MIELRSIHLTQHKQQLLSDFSLILADPGLYLLTGPVGSGKSLLSSLLAGQLKPRSGNVMIDGDPLYHPFRGYCGLIFHACAARLPDWSEPLGSYLTTELGRFNAKLDDMGHSWIELQGATGGEPDKLVSDLSASQAALLELALACAVPARLCILDGHLELLDLDDLEQAARWLSVVGTQQERYFLLTAHAALPNFPAFQGTLELAGGLPVRLA